jgi:hypothetical protein
VRKTVIRLALGTLLLTVGFRVEAQQPEKVFRIGVLGAPSASYISHRDHFGNDCASLGISKEKTWSLIFVMPKESSTVFRLWRRN